MPRAFKEWLFLRVVKKRLNAPLKISLVTACTLEFKCSSTFQVLFYWKTREKSQNDQRPLSISTWRLFWYSLIISNSVMAYISFLIYFIKICPQKKVSTEDKLTTWMMTKSQLKSLHYSLYCLTRSSVDIVFSCRGH